mgnify:CR=1 FL=1
MLINAKTKYSLFRELQFDKISESSTNRIFWYFAIGYCILWTSVPILTQPNAPLDTIEMLYWGNEWELGYYKHPPLPAWLAKFAYTLGGNSIWITYFLSQLCIFACFIAVFKVGKQTVGNQISLLNLIILQTCYYYNLTSPEFNNNVTSRAFGALSVLFLYQGIRKYSARDWILAGIFLGLGALCKYDIVILAVLMITFSVGHPYGRASWKTPGPFLLSAAALIIFLPHMYWLWNNDFPTIDYFLKRSNHERTLLSHLSNPVLFLFSQIPAILPVFILILFLTGRRWHWEQINSKSQLFSRDFLCYFGFGPIIVVFLIGVISGANFRSMWGSSLWTFSSLALLSSVQLRLSPLAIRKTVYCGLMFAVFFLSILIFRNSILPHFQEHGSRIHFPGQQLSIYVRNLYISEVGKEPVVVGGPWWEAANVACYGSHQLSVYADLNSVISPWMSDREMKQKGGVIVWNSEFYEEYLIDVKKRFPSATIYPPIRLSWQNEALHSSLKFRVAVVKPTNLESSNYQHP